MRIEKVTPHPTFSHFGHVTIVVKDVLPDELEWLLKNCERQAKDVSIIDERVVNKLRDALSLALQYVPAVSMDAAIQKEIDEIHKLIKQSIEDA